MSRPHLVLINAIHGRSGGGRIHLLEALPRLARLDDPEVRYLILARSDQVPELEAAGADVRTVKAPRNFALSFVWDQTLLPLLALRLRAGLVFSPANYGPWLLGGRCLLLVRSTFEAAESWASWREKLYWRLQETVARWSVRTARGGMVVSETFRKTVAARLGIPADWLVVNHHGHAAMFRPDPEPGDAEDALLAATSWWWRTSIPTRTWSACWRRWRTCGGRVRTSACAWWERRCCPAMPVPAGARRRAGPPRGHLFRPPVTGRAPPPLPPRRGRPVPLPRRVVRHDPGRGHGLRAPLVASDIPVFHEISGDAAVYADPTDVPAMVGTIAAVLDDGGLAARLSQAGRARAARFTWDWSARRVHDEVRNGASGFPPRHSDGGRGPAAQCIGRHAERLKRGEQPLRDGGLRLPAQLPARQRDVGLAHLGVVHGERLVDDGARCRPARGSSRPSAAPSTPRGSRG